MLDVVDVSKRFGSRVGIEDVTIAARPGEILGLSGRNGAGKTTLIRIVLGLLDADEGNVRWGREALSPKIRKSQFGYVPEKPGLYPKMLVLEQVRYFGQLSGLTHREAERRARSLLARLDLGQRGADRLDQLSEGNRRRVQLAVALLHEPALLVLDEPFAGLDATAVEALVELVRERALRGSVVILSSHRLDHLEQLCSHLAVLERGHVVASGPAAEVGTLSAYQGEVSDAGS